MPLRIIVIGDDPLARGGIAALAASGAELSVVAELAAADLALAPLDADVVVWDLGPGDDTDASAVVRATSLPVVALVGRAADEALAAGLRGVLARDIDAERLQSAVRAVAAGLIVVDDAFAGVLGKQRLGSSGEAADMLTPRELEVLGLLAEGLSNKLIGVRLGISEHTVKFHVNAILDKLDVETRTEAVVRGARLGLLML